MSENVFLDSRPSTENSDKIAGDDFKSTNEDESQDSASLQETGESDFNRKESVSDCTAEETSANCSFSANHNANLDDATVQPRTASTSFNSDSTEVSFVGKHENSLDSYAVARKSEGETFEIQATEDDPFIQSVKYLEKHQILRLFQNLAAQIVYKRPDNPFHYLIEELESSRGEASDSSTGSQEPDLLSRQQLTNHYLQTRAPRDQTPPDTVGSEICFNQLQSS